MELLFEWDDNKSRINLEKHGVTFEEAESVFQDDDALLMDDPDHSSYEEDRFLIIGFSVKSRILLVCHCYRQNDEMIRIISARKATKNEQKAYIRRNAYA